MINEKKFEKRPIAGKHKGLLESAVEMLSRCFSAGLVVLFFYGVAPSVARASNGQPENVTNLFVEIGVAWLLSAGLGWARPKLGLLITALMAIGVSLYLGQQHFESGSSICDVGSNFSCSDVNKSEYSEIFGVPLAYLGLHQGR